MNENLEAHLLAGVGLVRGVYEVVKPTNAVERVETAGLIMGVGGAVLAAYLIYQGLKENAPFISMER